MSRAVLVLRCALLCWSFSPKCAFRSQRGPQDRGSVEEEKKNRVFGGGRATVPVPPVPPSPYPSFSLSPGPASRSSPPIPLLSTRRVHADLYAHATNQHGGGSGSVVVRRSTIPSAETGVAPARAAIPRTGTLGGVQAARRQSISDVLVPRNRLGNRKRTCRRRYRHVGDVHVRGRRPVHCGHGRIQAKTRGKEKRSRSLHTLGPARKRPAGTPKRGAEKRVGKLALRQARANAHERNWTRESTLQRGVQAHARKTEKGGAGV